MRNTIIDNLRGICMLGVIGIHIGSLALAPNNFTLYLLLEILSRYSVPSFSLSPATAWPVRIKAF